MRSLEKFKSRIITLRGFTLVELMIVVAIIGLLASVAIPSFLTYINKSREAGYPLVFKKIVQGQRFFWERPRILANGDQGPACHLYIFNNWQPPVAGKEIVWDFTHGTFTYMRNNAEQIGVQGLKSYMGPPASAIQMGGGQGALCTRPTALPPSDFSTGKQWVQYTFQADADGDGQSTYFRQIFNFNADGSNWTSFFYKVPAFENVY